MSSTVHSSSLFQSQLPLSDAFHQQRLSLAQCTTARDHCPRRTQLLSSLGQTSLGSRSTGDRPHRPRRNDHDLGSCSCWDKASDHKSGRPTAGGTCTCRCGKFHGQSNRWGNSDRSNHHQSNQGGRHTRHGDRHHCLSRDWGSSAVSSRHRGSQRGKNTSRFCILHAQSSSLDILVSRSHAPSSPRSNDKFR